MQAFREAYKQYCGQLDIAPLYELTEDQLVEAAIKQSGHCNLQACRVTSSDVIALAQTMKFHPLIHSLDLRDNGLDDMSAMGLAEAMQTTGLPTSVDMRKNLVTDVGGQALLDAAKPLQMVALNLEGNQLSPKLLSEVQAFIAAKKQNPIAAAPTAATKAPGPASKRLAASRPSFDEEERSRNKKKQQEEEDDLMDLGFDSEIRGRKTPTSPSMSMRSTKRPADLNETTSPIPAAAAGPTSASGTGPRRSSFSEALRAANEDAEHAKDANASTGDFPEEEFDWNAADTGDLLDISTNKAPPAAAANLYDEQKAPAATKSTPAAATTVPAAAVAPSISRGPSLDKVASLSKTNSPAGTLTRPLSLPKKETSPAGTLTRALDVPKKEPSPADEFDEFNFDDSTSHFDHDAPAPTTQPSSTAQTTARSQKHPSFPPTPQEDGLLDRAELAAPGTVVQVEEDWSKGVGSGVGSKAQSKAPSQVASPRATAAAGTATSKSKQPTAADDELQQAQAAMRASIEASNALAAEAAKATAQTKQPKQVLAAPSAAQAKPKAVVTKSKPSGMTTFNAPAPVPVPVAEPEPLPAAPIVAHPTLLPPPLEHWTIDPSDPAATRLDLSGGGVVNPVELHGILSSYSGLRSLTLSSCGLTQIPSLPLSLEQLDLSLNELKSFRGLEELRQLLELNSASNSKLRDLSGLPPSIRLLNLSNNNLKNISGLGHLRQIQLLDLRMNQVSSIQALRELSVNSSLRVLRLQGNPIIQQFIPQGAKSPAASGLKNALLGLLPSLVQLDSHILVLNPLDILGAQASRGGASLLMDADLLDVVDLVNEISAIHGTQIKRLLIRMSQKGGDKTPNSSEPSILITQMFTHLLQLSFIPYFLPEMEGKVLLSLLSFSSPPRINVSGFIEFLARASCFKLHGLPTVTPAVIRNYSKQLKAQAMSDEGLFEHGYLNDVFFGEVQSPAQAWVYANYAIKLLGLLVTKPAAISSSDVSKTYHRPTSSTMHYRAASTSASSPAPSKAAVASASGSAKKKAPSSHARTGSTASNASDDSRTKSPAPGTGGKNVYDRLYTKPAAKPSMIAAPSPSAAAKSTPRKSPPPTSASRPGSAAKPGRKSPAPEPTKPIVDRKAMALRAAKFQREQEAAAWAEEQALQESERDAAAEDAEFEEQQRQAEEEAEAEAAEADAAEHDQSQDFDDEHYLPASAATASQPTGVENTMSPTQGKLRARIHTAPSAAQRAAQHAREDSGSLAGGADDDADPSIPAVVSNAAPVSMDDDSWLDDVDVSTARGIKRIIKNLNEKINKLYSWHLVEIDLVSRQQMQLNSLKTDIEVTKSSSSIAGTPTHSQSQSSFGGSGVLNFEPFSPQHSATQQSHFQHQHQQRTPVHPQHHGGRNFSPNQTGTQMSNPPSHQQQQRPNALSIPSPSGAMSSGAPPQSQSNPAAAASSDDWASLMHALQILEQTDPNCAEVQILRELMKQEQVGGGQQNQNPNQQNQTQQFSQTQPQPLQQPPQHQQYHPHRSQQPSPQNTQWQAYPLPQHSRNYSAPAQQQQQNQFIAPMPQQSQRQPQQHQPPQQQPQFQASYPPQNGYRAPTNIPPSPLSQSGSFTPASFVSHPPSGSITPAQVQSILSSFWLPDVRDWCRELDEELRTATMALGNILDLTAGPAKDDPIEYAKAIRDFEHILSISGMLVSFGLPSHVAAMLPILPPDLLAAIRGSAHRLEATKKSLHAFLSLIHAEEPNSTLVQELRQTILTSGVTNIPSSSLDQLAISVATKMAGQGQAPAASHMQPATTPQSSPNLIRPAAMHNSYGQPRQSQHQSTTPRSQAAGQFSPRAKGSMVSPRGQQQQQSQPRSSFGRGGVGSRFN